jgi:hypothetical protein
VIAGKDPCRELSVTSGDRLALQCCPGTTVFGIDSSDITLSPSYQRYGSNVILTVKQPVSPPRNGFFTLRSSLLSDGQRLPGSVVRVIVSPQPLILDTTRSQLIGWATYRRISIS